MNLLNTLHQTITVNGHLFDQNGRAVEVKDQPMVVSDLVQQLQAAQRAGEAARLVATTIQNAFNVLEQREADEDK
jgi:hypothetical protein